MDKKNNGNSTGTFTEESEEPMSWADFLETIPPNKAKRIEDLCDANMEHQFNQFTLPDLQLHCDDDICKGDRIFTAVNSTDLRLYPRELSPHFLRYKCRNCQISVKIFALLLKSDGLTKFSGVAIKLGEYPAFGPPIPSRVISLIGPDRNLFIQGRRAENQGLGIGAFSYYRRVVENQKGRLIREISKVAKLLGAATDQLQRLDQAANEEQFSKAIDSIKDGIPQILLIQGHNPLKLLYSALSQGLHAGTDEECLEMATSIRVILTELAERISQALKDETEIRKALSNLFPVNQGG